jgi:hypothetical protein
LTTTVTASDGASSAGQAFQWTISNPVMMISPGEQLNARGDEVSLPIMVSAAAGETLTYSAAGLPTGLSIDAGTGLITGRIGADEAARSFAATVTATDGTYSATQAFSWRINTIVVAGPGGQANAEGDPVLLPIQANDSGGAPLTYSASGLPDGLGIDPSTGLISGTISAGTADNGPFTAIVTASDGTLSTSQAFPWTMSTVRVISPSEQSSTEGDQISLPIQASDTRGGTLTYAAGNLPAGLSMDPNTGLITGTINPGAGANGPLTTTITATNGTFSASRTIQWSVTSPVAITSFGDQSNREGDAVALSILAGNTQGGSLTYSATQLPKGLSIDPNTGLISGTISPGASLAAPLAATVTATDGTYSTAKTVTWHVRSPIRIAGLVQPDSTAADQASLLGQLQTLASTALAGRTAGLPPVVSTNPTTSTTSAEVAANGLFSKTVSFSSQWQTIDSAWLPGSSGAAGTAIETLTYASTDSVYTIVSDNAANLPSEMSPPSSGANPAVLLTAPLAGTTSLFQLFDVQTSNGTVTLTEEYDGDGLLIRVSVSVHSEISGQTGLRLFSLTTATEGNLISDPYSNNPIQDKTTLRQDYLETVKYQDTFDADLGSPGEDLPVSGIVKTWSFIDDNVLKDEFDYTDEYIRLGLNGTYRLSTANKTSYTDEREQQTAYQDSRRTADQQSDRFEGSSDGKVTRSNECDYTIWLPLPGTYVYATGATSGKSTINTTSKGHTDWLDVVTLNLMNNDEVVSTEVRSRGSGSSRALVTANYESTNGKAQQKSFLFWIAGGDNSGRTTVTGKYKGQDQLLGSTYADESKGNSQSFGILWNTTQVQSLPTQTIFKVFSSTTSSDSRTDLARNAAGTINGTVANHLSTSVNNDVTLTTQGTAQVPYGTVTFNDRNHNQNRVDSSLDVYLWVTNGVPNGLVTLKTAGSVSYDYTLDEQVDRIGIPLHAQLSASGSGSAKTQDKVTTAVVLGQEFTWRTSSSSLASNENANMTAHGQLGGSAGSWTYRASNSNRVNDKVTAHSFLKGDDWVETSRTFAINETRNSSLKYHEEGPGGGSWTYADLIIQPSHTHDYSADRSTTIIENGSPGQYTYSYLSSAHGFRYDLVNGPWVDSVHGGTGLFRHKSYVITTVRENREGTSTNGLQQDALIDRFRLWESVSRDDGSSLTSEGVAGGHTFHALAVTLSQYGNWQEGTGKLREVTSTANWAQVVSPNGQVTTGGDPNGQTVSTTNDLSWSQNGAPQSQSWLGWAWGRIVSWLPEGFYTGAFHPDDGYVSSVNGFGQAVSNMWSQPGPRDPNSIGQPSFGESLIPIWGSGRSAIDHLQNGELLSGIFQGALAITDVFLIKSLVVGGIKLAGKCLANRTATEVGGIVLKEGAAAGEKALAKSGAPSHLFGHNEYVVADAAHATRVRQGLEAYYRRHAPPGATIRWVDNVPGGRNGFLDAVTGDIRLSSDVLSRYPHLADGLVMEELQHFHQLQSRGWIGRNLTGAENALIEHEVVKRIQRSGFRIFGLR